MIRTEGLLAEITAGWGSLKAAKDIVQALNGMQTAVAINDVKLTLQGHILDAQKALFSAQKAQASAVQRIAELKEQLGEFKNWASEAERCELVRIGAGSFAYVQKEGMRTAEPPHWLCTPCFGNHKKSVLQRQEKQGDRERPWICPACKSGITLSYTAAPTYEAAVWRQRCLAERETASRISILQAQHANSQA